MEYVFGTRGGMEVLRTKGEAHTDLAGFQQTAAEFPGETVVDSFRVVRKLRSGEDPAGNRYDWYEIDRHYRTIDRTGPIAAKANRAMAAAEAAFVTLAESGAIDAAAAGEHTELFALWAAPVAYKAGNIRRYTDGRLYQCLQEHTSQENWTPDASPSLWKQAADPAEAWPTWSPPLGAHDAYEEGDRVSHRGKRWISTARGNVWEPGVYGWEVTEQ